LTRANATHVKLVLFDIDGTILAGGGAGKRAVTRALIDVFGSAGPADHRFDGKTDRQIVRELMRLEGHDDAHIDARMPALLDRYLAYLDDELRAPPFARLLPGVAELLDALEARHDMVLGLLTGNLAAGARAKLAAVGLDPDRFRVGVPRIRDRRGCLGTTCQQQHGDGSAENRNSHVSLQGKEISAKDIASTEDCAEGV